MSYRETVAEGFNGLYMFIANIGQCVKFKHQRSEFCSVSLKILRDKYKLNHKQLAVKEYQTEL